MPAVPIEFATVAAGAGVAALVVAALDTAWRGWRAGRRMSHALAAEKKAEKLLKKEGYRVVGRQVERTYPVEVDDEPQEFTLRADLVVTRGGKRYVAEVKTGEVAPSLKTAPTRRQLLEYRIAYDVDGVLLVDMEQHKIYEVRFPLPVIHRAWWATAGLVAGLTIAAVAIAVLRNQG